MYGNFQLFADSIEISDYAGNVSWQNNVSHSRSIEEMKNSIKVVTEKDNVYSQWQMKSFSDRTNTRKQLWY